MNRSQLVVAPGARVEIRDEEWVVRTVKPEASGGQAIEVTGVSGLQVYEDVKALVTRCGGAVLPLTANFRTVPSVIGFVNDRFREIFVEPGDPDPIALEPYRDEVDPKGSRAIALTVPPEQMPDDTRLEPRRAVVAEMIAAFIDDITRVKPWPVNDPSLEKTRPARPGDVAILVRKMTPDFIAPFEDSLRARQVNYRLVGGKEYFLRDEVRALAAVLRAIDNPADRLSLVQALRSPFFTVSDADLLHFVSTKGVLNVNAPQSDGVAKRHVFDPVFLLLARLHRLRRIESPSVIIEELFARTRAMSGFLMKASGAQMVAGVRPSSTRPGLVSALAAVCRPVALPARPLPNLPDGTV